MACACKVSQQLDYLNKKYGEKTPESKKTNIRGRLIPMMLNILAKLFVVLLVPFMIVFIIIKAITKKPIKIDKFVKKSKDV